LRYDENPVALFSVNLLMGLTALFGCIWGSVAFPFGLAVLHSTSCGGDEIEWPNILFLNSIGEVMYVLCGIGVSAAVAFGLASLAHLEGAVRFFFIAGCFHLVFPIVLLSSLIAEMPAVPFSLMVWRAIAKAWWVWGLFYVLTCLVIGGSAMLWGLSLMVDHACNAKNVLSTVSGAVLLSAAWLIYFRMFGRLVWYCSDTLAARNLVADEDDEEDDEEG
jgi:hypothetical protein